MHLPLLRVAAVVGSTVLAATLRAQCPNGTPPPCAGTRATGTTLAPNSVAVLYTAFDPVRRDPSFVQFETTCLALREGG